MKRAATPHRPFAPGVIEGPRAPALRERLTDLALALLLTTLGALCGALLFVLLGLLP